MLHFTSIGYALLVITDETREAINETRRHMIHRPLLDLYEAIHDCSNKTETDIHLVSKLTNFSILSFFFLWQSLETD